MYSFPNLEPVCCFISSFNCFLTCMQISQGGSQVVWYSHLLKNFPQFVVIHTFKGFGVCPTLCDSMDYTVHEILQARILEWVAFSFSRGSSQPREFGSGRSPGEGNGNPLQYSCLKNSMDRPWGHKELGTTE